MTQGFSSSDHLLLTVVLATLAVGLPIVFVLAIRFLWERNVSIGRSKEMEKLIWQLHRIASAMEHRMNLAFPPVQPGTEEPRDLAYLQQRMPAPGAAPVASPQGAVPQPQQQSAVPASNEHPGAVPQAPAHPAKLVTREPGVEAPRAGVNSMFDL